MCWGRGEIASTQAFKIVSDFPQNHCKTKSLIKNLGLRLGGRGKGGKGGKREGGRGKGEGGKGGRGKGGKGEGGKGEGGEGVQTSLASLMKQLS